jgi:hypothetical protein
MFSFFFLSCHVVHLDFLLFNAICVPLGIWLVFCYCSLAGDPYKYNALPPLPAQRNLTPPPTLYPQQPVSVTESYSIPRFTLTGSQEISNTARLKRMDINVWWSSALDLLCKECTFPWCWALFVNMEFLLFCLQTVQLIFFSWPTPL